MAKKLHALRDMAEDVDSDLDDDWAALRTGYDEKNGTAVQLAIQDIILGFRLKAVTRFFLDGDRVGFFESAYHAALTFDLGNRLIRAGMPHDPNIFSVTNARGFYEALLTLPPDDVAQVVRAMPAELRGQDDRTQFYFVAFLMQMAVGAREGPKKTLAKLTALANEGSDVAIELGICESLNAKDPRGFTEAMKAFLNRRAGQIAAEDDDVNPGEEYVSIEGLAIRRLAATLGMETTIRHALTPAELQENYPDPATFSRGPVPVLPPDVAAPGFGKDWAPVESW